jgi:putative transposase
MENKWCDKGNKGHHDSFTIDASGKPISVGGKSIKLPTIGWG